MARIFKSGRAYGVECDQGGLIYEASFVKKTAERIAKLESRKNPPEDWFETEEILKKEGYDLRHVEPEYAD